MKFSELVEVCERDQRFHLIFDKGTADSFVLCTKESAVGSLKDRVLNAEVMCLYVAHEQMHVELAVEE